MGSNPAPTGNGVMKKENKKVRDYVTMREYTNGTGVGPHKSQRDKEEKEYRREKQRKFSDLLDKEKEV